MDILPTVTRLDRESAGVKPVAAGEKNHEKEKKYVKSRGGGVRLGGGGYI